MANTPDPTLDTVTLERASTRPVRWLLTGSPD
ncbi:MAG: hypothetical protein JWQ86_421 [Mycobacterium sp.]|jgi:hypothetical protein|nr:hypothetical protein [Mycobacterium sp.]MDT5249149.1 hypothetical protein [Mycobacterium sp.]